MKECETFARVVQGGTEISACDLPSAAPEPGALPVFGFVALPSTPSSSRSFMHNAAALLIEVKKIC